MASISANHIFPTTMTKFNNGQFPKQDLMEPTALLQHVVQEIQRQRNRGNSNHASTTASSPAATAIGATRVATGVAGLVVSDHPPVAQQALPNLIYQQKIPLILQGGTKNATQSAFAGNLLLDPHNLSALGSSSVAPSSPQVNNHHLFHVPLHHSIDIPALAQLQQRQQNDIQYNTRQDVFCIPCRARGVPAEHNHKVCLKALFPAHCFFIRTRPTCSVGLRILPCSDFFLLSHPPT